VVGKPVDLDCDLPGAKRDIDPNGPAPDDDRMVRGPAGDAGSAQQPMQSAFGLGLGSDREGGRDSTQDGVSATSHGEAPFHVGKRDPALLNGTIRKGGRVSQRQADEMIDGSAYEARHWQTEPLGPLGAIDDGADGA
jgi:hypothetical protein